MTVKWALRITLLCFACQAGLGAKVQASMPMADYLAALKSAQKKVERTRAAHLPGALSSSMLRRLFGRYYQVGDSWDVAAFRIDQNQMRMTAEPEKLKSTVGAGGIFHYEVVSVKSIPEPEVEVTVTQLTAYGLDPVDKRVEHLTLTMNDHLKQSLKAYAFKGRRESVRVSPDGLRSSITPLELLPLDVPEVDTAEAREPSEFPSLPPKIQAVADQASYHPDLSQSLWLEQDDFFGRPIQFLWQHGDPWPAYLKTPVGIAILIRKETAN